MKIPFCATIPEDEGFHAINRGIVQFHKNAKGHREGAVGKTDALKIIGYIDYLISMVETGEIKS